MNLHCSQTSRQPIRPPRSLIPYEFALLSNQIRIWLHNSFVWFPYEFALLSNIFLLSDSEIPFDSPTNLHCSQTTLFACGVRSSLIPLRICTALKRGRKHKRSDRCLIPLRICTALKPILSPEYLRRSLIPLRICTALKPNYGLNVRGVVWFPYEFALLSN